MPDSDTQVYNKTLKEVGTAILGEDTGTVDVSTSLSTVLSAVASYNTGNLIAGSLRCSALSSGAITITDSHGASNAGAIVSFHFEGYP